MVEVPNPVTLDSHGLETEITDWSVKACYGSAFIACGYNSVEKKDEVYRFDAKTGEWTKMPENKALMQRVMINYGQVGNCLITSNAIVDLESGETFGDFGNVDYFSRSYFGGFSNITHTSIQEGFQFQEVQYDGSASYLTGNVIRTLGIESGANRMNIIPLDKTYYLYTDDAGLFLRTYEKGSEQEEMIYRKKS